MNADMNPIKVLIVEDSLVALKLLVHILGHDPKIQIIGTANNGEDAIKAAARLKPDIITMDIYLPKMDGFEATRCIMETYPTPIVIVTGSAGTKEVSMAMRAMEAGALAVVRKPVSISHSDYEAEAGELVRIVKLMAEVKVVRRWARLRSEPPVLPRTDVSFTRPAEIKLAAIGASTGGPPVIRTILSNLPKRFPAPVLVVQHMVGSFIPGFVEWLNQTSSLPVHVAFHGASILPGNVYVAPDGFQMGVERPGRISLMKDKSENGLCPSVSYLFRSVADSCGKNAIGILLTGMGKDGALELKLMKDKGAITIAQDKESSVIHGMPGEAIRIGAAVYVLSPSWIVTTLCGLVNNMKEEKGIDLWKPAVITTG